MSDKPHALSTLPPASPAEPDYDSICGAVMATPRGRWFLNEYARRNRNSDTSQVLAAIERMEAAITGERVQQTNQDVRIELLEMARAIAQTRADVAETRADSPPLRAGAQSNAAAPPDIAGAAERLRDIAWTMRACGVELATSEQIEQLAETILSASSLHAGNGDRTRKLGEVLHYLEHRIDRMLDSHMDKASAGTSRTVPEDFPAPPQEPPAPNGHDRDAAVAAVEAPHAADSAPAAMPLGEPSYEIAATGVAAFEAVIDTDRAEATETAANSEIESAPVHVATPDAAVPAGNDAQSKAAEIEPATELTWSASDIADERPATFDLTELRVERAELELEPMVVVPVSIAEREEVAPPTPQPKVDGIASVVAQASPDETPASTGDHALDVAFALPEAPPAAVPEPNVEDRIEPAFAGLDVEPLVVAPVGPVQRPAESPPGLDLDAVPHSVDGPEPAAASHATVEHALDQELALPALAVAMQPVQAEVQVAQPLESVFPDAPPAPDYDADALETAALGPKAVAVKPETVAITASVMMSADPAAGGQATTPTASIVFEPEPVGATSPELAESSQTEHMAPAPDLPATTEAAPIAAAEPAPPVVTGEADSVAMQVDEDLFALMEIPADAASETAADVVAPPPEQTPASVAASAPEPPHGARPESDVLSSAWETAVQSPPEFPERPSDRRPVPSMWEHPPSARLAREDAAADFMHEPVAPGDTPIQPPAAASAPLAADRQVQIENDLFADQPGVADLVPLPITAVAISEAAAPQPDAAAALPEPSGPSEAQPPSAVTAAPARLAVKPMPRHTADDPLGALTAMTDEERIALFT